MKPADLSLPMTILPHGEGLALPAYHSHGAAGLDLMAAIDRYKILIILPHNHCFVPSGIALSIPFGFEGQVRPRSGLALKFGVTVLNSPGTIDSDYRGEIGVILVNLGEKPFSIQRGDRIAQLVIAPVSRVRLELATRLDETRRGADGFGSTG
jgi:dUTP pyrophosphatase